MVLYIRAEPVWVGEDLRGRISWCLGERYCLSHIVTLQSAVRVRYVYYI